MKAPVLVSAVPLLVSTKSVGLNVNMVPSDTEEDNTEDEASTASTTQPSQETLKVAKTPSPINQLPVDSEAQNRLAAGKILDYNDYIFTKRSVWSSLCAQ